MKKLPKLALFKRGRKKGSKDKKKRVISANDTDKNIRLALTGSRESRRTVNEVLGWLRLLR